MTVRQILRAWVIILSLIHICGIGMYLFDFLKELVKYKEFDIYLITDVKKSEYIKSCSKMGLKVISYGKPVRMQDVFSYFGFIQKQLDIIKPDVFWEINNLIPKKLKGDFKTVVTIHDMFPITPVSYTHLYY